MLRRLRQWYDAYERLVERLAAWALASPRRFGAVAGTLLAAVGAAWGRPYFVAAARDGLGAPVVVPDRAGVHYQAAWTASLMPALFLVAGAAALFLALAGRREWADALQDCTDGLAERAAVLWRRRPRSWRIRWTPPRLDYANLFYAAAVVGFAAALVLYPASVAVRALWHGVGWNQPVDMNPLGRPLPMPPAFLLLYSAAMAAILARALRLTNGRGGGREDHR